MTSDRRVYLYWCGDCEAWSSSHCNDSTHHRRSFVPIEYVPAAPHLAFVTELEASRAQS